MFKNFAQLFKAIVLIDRKWKGVILAASIGACIIPATGASAAGCEPGPKEVTFFQHVKYKGICSVLGVGEYPNSKALNMRNDSISSIKVGSRATVTVCKHSAKGRVTNRFFSDPQKCQTFKESRAYLSITRIGNDSISSAAILPKFGGYTGTTNGACKPSPGQEAVAVYQHPNYQGACRLLTIGTYNNSKEMQFKNDSVSSIEFGQSSNVEIVVYQHSNRNGRLELIRENTSNLSKSQIGDNSISSILVRRKK